MTPTHFTLTMGFFLGLAGLAFHRTYTLSALLCLEGMMLALFMSLSLWTLQLNSTNFSSAPMLLLAFSACEASVGLSLLVATSRTHGTTYLQGLTILRC
uniref:NADH-ubiquinone oxidoreductase chain 4L n=1 Tax=Centropristis striata TaxID=184440 RepID=A0A5J6BSL2_CENSR|nr:NADH dehydrogenase subunit 4L [Centropristis striata]QEP94861.1 NADH dehydrogenase subunit 4L [Centropristis striata]WMY90508.1 NADH dehydrogenase subunit 4L [Centropristis striata]